MVQPFWRRPVRRARRRFSSVEDRLRKGVSPADGDSRQCVQRDDMDRVLGRWIPRIRSWATPLYHFGMTAMLKAVMERTLADPHIVKDCDVYHPGRSGAFAVPPFSSCGFPIRGIRSPGNRNHSQGDRAQDNLSSLSRGRTHGRRRSGRTYSGIDALRQAGKEYVEHGGISGETMEVLHRDLVPQEMYISQANAHWDSVLKGK